MFTFDLVTPDGRVFDTVTVRAASITEAARTLISYRLDIVLTEIA
jgi:hypothetical protein